MKRIATPLSPLLPLLLLVPTLGCPADDAEGSQVSDTGADDGEGSADDDGGTGRLDDTGSGGDAGPGACGEGGEENLFYDPPGQCYNNMGCATCNCRTFRDNPPLAEAVCEPDPADGQLTVTATVLEFPGNTPIPATEVAVYNALEIGLMGPDNATPIGETTADGDGRIELEVTPVDQIGIVATIRASGFVDTATGLAKPPYEASNAIHDLFAVPQSDIDAWNAALGNDAALEGFLPLGDNGGVVGVARNRYTGEPAAGIKIVSLDNGANTGAIVRYLNTDGTFNADATTSTGVYVLFNPVLAEEFEAAKDGVVVSTRANRAGSGAPAVFTMNLTINLDPGVNPFE